MKPYEFDSKKKYSLKRYCAICRKQIDQNSGAFYKPLPRSGTHQRWLACSYDHAYQVGRKRAVDFVRIYISSPKKRRKRDG